MKLSPKSRHWPGHPFYFTGLPPQDKEDVQWSCRELGCYWTITLSGDEENVPPMCPEEGHGPMSSSPPSYRRML